MAKQEKRAFDVHFCYLEQQNEWDQTQDILNTPRADVGWESEQRKDIDWNFAWLSTNFALLGQDLSGIDNYS